MNLQLSDLASLSPLLILLGFAILLLLVESFAQKIAEKTSFWLACLAFLMALCAVFTSPSSDHPLLNPWIQFTLFSRSFVFFFLSVGLASVLLSGTFFYRFPSSQGEYYFLLLSATFGLILIASAADFLTLFIGLETLSIALYVLCGYVKKWETSHESAIKYFLIGSISAALLLYGIALIYGAVGTTRLSELEAAYKALSAPSNQMLFLGGMALVTFGLAFKAAIVPFHTWAPDVYEGSPTPVTAFMAVGTKAGAFAALMLLVMVLPHFDPVWNQVVGLLAYPTLIYANLVALRQMQLRRFFAYSGISHAGFLLILIAVGNAEALSALFFYLIIYAVATFGAFAVLTLLDQDSKGVVLQDLRGLFRRAPLLASIMTLSLLTLAGIPPTAGFLAKFYLFKVAFQAGYYGLVVVGLLTSILAAYYYLRFIAIMLEESMIKEKIKLVTPAVVVGCAALLAITLISIYPRAIYQERIVEQIVENRRVE